MSSYQFMCFVVADRDRDLMNDRMTEMKQHLWLVFTFLIDIYIQLSLCDCAKDAHEL